MSTNDYQAADKAYAATVGWNQLNHDLHGLRAEMVAAGIADLLTGPVARTFTQTEWLEATSSEADLIAFARAVRVCRKALENPDAFRVSQAERQAARQKKKDQRNRAHRERTVAARSQRGAHRELTDAQVAERAASATRSPHFEMLDPSDQELLRGASDSKRQLMALARLDLIKLGANYRKAMEVVDAHKSISALLTPSEAQEVVPDRSFGDNLPVHVRIRARKAFERVLDLYHLEERRLRAVEELGELVPPVLLQPIADEATVKAGLARCDLYRKSVEVVGRIPNHIWRGLKVPFQTLLLEPGTVLGDDFPQEQVWKVHGWVNDLRGRLSKES